MNNRNIAIIVSGVALLLCATAMMVVPHLQAPTVVISGQSMEATERARRMLDQYHAELEASVGLAERSELVPGLTTENLQQVTANDSQVVQAVLTEEAERINALVSQTQNRLRSLDARAQELAGDTEVPPRGKVRFGSNVSAMARDLATGVAARDALQQQGSGALRDAESTIRAALQKTIGDASGRDNLHANRMHGVVLYEQGLARHREAARLQSAAARILHDLAATTGSLGAVARQTQLVNASGVQALIQGQQEALREKERTLAALTEEHDAVTLLIEQTEAAIRVADDAARTARQRLETLESEGLAYELGDAVQRFRDAYAEQARIYREAVHEAEALRHGTLAAARLDDSGDFVTGRYVGDPPGVEIDPIPGLDEHMRHAEELTRQVAAAQVSLQITREALDRLSARRVAYVERAQRAVEDEALLQQQVRTRYTAFADAFDELTAREDDALRLFRESARAFSQAQRIARTQMADVPTDLSPEAQERSHYKLISEARWLPGQLQASVADAELRAAMVLLDRFDLLQTALAAFEQLAATMPLDGFDAQAMRDDVTTTRQEAEQRLDAAATALENASRDLRQHWTVAASVAAVHYTASLFDHPELAKLALENYRVAIDGRQDNPMLQPFIERYEQLRAR